MGSFEAFPQAPRQETNSPHESPWDTAEGAADLLMHQWSDHVQASQSPERQTWGEDQETLDASNLAVEHMDHQAEERIVECWADEVPDAIKPDVATRLRRGADPDLVKLLDNYSERFRSLPAD